MSALFDTMSEELFQILKGSGKTLTLYDVNGNRVYDPSQARTVFAEPDKMVLSVKESGDDSEIKLYLSQSADISKIAKLINTLRHISTRYNVLFNVRKYGRELSPKDFAFQAEPMSEAITEAMWGTTKTSYQRIGDAKLIVRHCEPVREDVIGGRGRNILALFVETKSGERFKFPPIHLSGARAWAQHLNQGGQPQDQMGTHIIELALESSKLASVNRYMNYSRKTLPEGAQGFRFPIRSRLAEIRKALVSYSRPKGYQKALEHQASILPNLLQESQSVVHECQRVGSILGIDATHALAECLLPVAMLTIGENKMFNNSNESFRRILTVEHDEHMAELVEALVNEYGHEEHIGFALEEGLLSVTDEVLEDAVNYLNSMNETAYHVFEEDEDKFLAYAKKWISGRLGAAGEGSMLSPEHEKDAAALASGLKGIIAGQAPGKPVFDGAPRFSNPRAEMAFKIGAFLHAGSGLKNDALWTYMSALVDALQHGSKLTSTEQMFAQKIASMADAQNESVDETVFVEAGNPFDPDSANYGALDQEFEDACEEIAGDFNKWHLKSFIAAHYPYFDENGSTEDPVSTDDVLGDLTGFLNDLMARQYDIEDGDTTDLAKQLFPEVEAFAERNGWTFDKQIDEARTQKVTFESSIDFEGDDDFEIKVTAVVDDDYIDFDEIISKADGRDITDQLTRNQLEDLQVQAVEAAAEAHAEYLDHMADMKRDRMMDEDQQLKVLNPFHDGDQVSTPMGPGVIVDEPEGMVVKVEMMNGQVKPFHIGDIEKVDLDQEMGRMKEELDLEAWFEQFEPHAVLAPARAHQVTLEDVQNSMLKLFSPDKMDRIWDVCKSVAQDMINNPADYGIGEVAKGSDDYNEERYEAASRIAAAIAQKFKEEITEIVASTNEGLEEEELTEYGAKDFQTKDGVVQKLLKYLKNHWDLAQAASDKMVFNKTIGKVRFKLTVQPESVILDVIKGDEILNHQRFGPGNYGALHTTMQKYAAVRENFTIDDSVYLPDLSEDCEDEEVLGGDKSDDFISDVKKEEVEESELARLRKLAGL